MSIPGDGPYIRRIMGLHPEGATGWLRDGLLDVCATRRLMVPGRRHHILGYFLDFHAYCLQTDEADTMLALSRAFDLAIQSSDEIAARILFDASMGGLFQLDLRSYDSITWTDVTEWWAKGGFEYAYDNLKNHMHQANDTPQTTSTKTQSPTEQLRQAVWTDDDKAVERLLKTLFQEEDEMWSYEINGLNQIAASHGNDSIALALIRHLDTYRVSTLIPLCKLLHYDRVGVVSEFLCESRGWKFALTSTNSRPLARYDVLEDALCRRLFMSNKDLRTPSDALVEQQVFLRALSYYAIHTNDQSLLSWLLDSGLDMDAIVCKPSSYQAAHDPLVYKSSARAGFKVDFENHTYEFSSLLAVAAGHDRPEMMKLLINRGADRLDSYALSCAINSHASDAVISILLDTANGIGVPMQRQYGSAALCHAIKNRDYDLMRTLLRWINVNGRDSFTGMTPLGKAVTRGDLQAAQILFEHGADLNALITLRGIKNAEGSALARSTAVLAAIDLDNLAMLTFLSERGAELDYDPKLGLLRTPLQRAAELGRFDIVRYLINQNIRDDRTPCYGGGTALQFAAIGGYVGVANLLLDYGANVNHPPAEGPGRTALEGAAEWGRLDMITMLVQRGVGMELEVDDYDEGKNVYRNDDPFPWGRRFGHDRATTKTTQGQRAIRLAKASGHVALSRIIEKIRTDQDEQAFRPQEEYRVLSNQGFIDPAMIMNWSG
ncbi:hypothetical protein NX059_006546 [Plenodomus lindquistii]|nr:hypothetical protein NX059_006546 [Plenodomus lindquistii]